MLQFIFNRNRFVSSCIPVSYWYNSDDSPTAIAVDVNGNVYVTGSSYGSGTNQDYATIRYSSNGSQIWAKRFNGTGNDDDKAKGLVINNTSNIVVTGSSLDSSGKFKIVTINYHNSTGYTIWQNTYNGSYNGHDNPNAIASQGLQVYVGGSVQQSANDEDYILLKYNVTSGTQAFAVNYDGYGSYDAIHSLAFDNTGKLYCTGICTNNNIIEYQTQKYDTSGTLYWTHKQTLNLSYSLTSPTIKIDNWNMLYVCGETMNTNRDYVLYQLNSNGDYQWTETYNSPHNGNDFATDMAIDYFGRIYVTGQIQNGTLYNITTIKYSQSFVYFPPDYNGETAVNSALFYENKGQLINTNDSLIPEERFYTNSFFYPQLYFTDTNMSYVFSKIDTVAATVDTMQRIDMGFVKSNIYAKSFPLLMDSSYLNYFLPQCPNGATNVRGYSRLFVPNIYHNIDLHYYSNDLGLKYYFVAKPFGEPEGIKMRFSGADTLIITADSNLIIRSQLGDIVYEPPTAYQVDSTLNIVPLAWNADWYFVNDTTVGMSISTYNYNLPLVIQVDKGHLQQQQTAASTDNLTWSTYFGGNNDDGGFHSAVDVTGDLYICGTTYNANFPAINIINTVINNYSNAFCAKFDITRHRKWTTSFGGSNWDWAYALAIDTLNNVYFGGYTESSDFPHINLTGAYNDTTFGGSKDCFIVKLTKHNGTALWSTYFGESQNNDEDLTDMAINKNNELYICGYTTRISDFPIDTPNNYQYRKYTTGIQLGFISKFDVNNSITWSTLFGSGGSSINALAIDTNNNVFITGSTENTLNDLPNFNNYGGNIYSYQGGKDAFIAKFDNMDMLRWSTFYGGSSNDSATGLAISKLSQDVYIVGITKSNDFPLDYNAYPNSYIDSIRTNDEGFIARFNNNGVRSWSTYFGGSLNEKESLISIDDVGNVYIVGGTNSTNIDTISKIGYYQQNSIPYSFSIAYISSFNRFDSLVWSTYFGAKNCSNCQTHPLSISIFNKSKLFITGISNLDNNYDFPFRYPGAPAYIDSTYKYNYYDCFISEFNITSNTSSNITNYKTDDNSLFIYPNPSKGFVNFIYTSNKNEKINICVYNNLGQLIKSFEFNKQIGNYNGYIDLSNYSDGIYLIKIITKRSITSKKIIINKN